MKSPAAPRALQIVMATVAVKIVIKTVTEALNGILRFKRLKAI